MLSAAVAGGVFASPPPASILAAVLCLHNAGNEHTSSALFGCQRAGYECIVIDLLYIDVLKACSTIYLKLQEIQLNKK